MLSNRPGSQKKDLFMFYTGVFCFSCTKLNISAATLSLFQVLLWFIDLLDAPGNAQVWKHGYDTSHLVVECHTRSFPRVLGGEDW